MTSEPNAGMEQITAGLHAQLEATHRVREQTLRLCRECIQHAAKTIRAVHRQERENAAACLEEAYYCLTRIREILAQHRELYYSGYVHDAQKEYVEAVFMLAIVETDRLPRPEDLLVEPAAYLNGIAEAASESRRHVLDLMRTGQMERAESVLQIMDDIYSTLINFDFPDAITSGLRRSTDSLRAVLERTRADLTLTLSLSRLEKALNLQNNTNEATDEL